MRSLVSILILLGLLVLGSTAQNVDLLVQGITQIFNQLEAYALGSLPSSGISFNELWRVSRLYESSDPSTKAAVRNSPASRLVIDFAIAPMKMISYQIENNPEVISRHLRRVENAFKHFRPAYMGEQIGDYRINIKTPKISKLFDLLTTEPPSEELTTKHFMDAKREHDSWHARVDEITQVEDVFSFLDELQSIFNYFNADIYKPLFVAIFPTLTPYSDVNILRQTYHERLWSEFHLKIVNGKLTNLASAEPLVQTAGSTHVENA